MSASVVREASRDGHRVAVLRCYDGPDGLTVVEAEVRNASGEPVRRGPYRFPNAPEAFRFIQESLLALQYLGCTVAGA